MNEVFVVTGETGEYSDHSEWIVAWFMTEVEAQEYAAACQEIASHVDRSYDTFYHPLDPNFHMDYTGTEYRVSAIPKAVWCNIPTKGFYSKENSLVTNLQPLSTKQKPKIKICEKCEHYTDSTARDIHKNPIWTCRLSKTHFGVVESEQRVDFEIPSGCPFVLEHVLEKDKC